MIGGVDGNYAGSFLVWRGSSIKQEYVVSYEMHAGTGIEIRLSSCTSTSRSLIKALIFALGVPNPQLTPVLFVFLFRNYSGVNGLMMNNEAFTAYPCEGELLL